MIKKIFRTILRIVKCMAWASAWADKIESEIYYHVYSKENYHPKAKHEH